MLSASLTQSGTPDASLNVHSDRRIMQDLVISISEYWNNAFAESTFPDCPPELLAEAIQSLELLQGSLKSRPSIIILPNDVSQSKSRFDPTIFRRLFPFISIPFFRGMHDSLLETLHLMIELAMKCGDFISPRNMFLSHLKLANDTMNIISEGQTTFPTQVFCFHDFTGNGGDMCVLSLANTASSLVLVQNVLSLLRSTIASSYQFMADLSSPYWNAIIRAVNLFGKSMASLDIHFAILDSYLLVPFNNLDSIDPFLPFLRFIYTILEEQSHEIISNSRWAEKLDKILGVLAKDFQRDRALTYQSLFEEMIAQTNYVKLPLETKDRIFAIYRSILSVTRQSPPDRFSIFIMSTFSPYHCSLPSIVPLIADILDIIFKAEYHKLDGNSRLAGISPSPYHSNLVVPEIGQKVLPPRKRLVGHDDQTVQIEPDYSMEPTTTIAFSYASPMKIFVDVLKEHVEKIGVSSDPRSVLNIFESIECLLRAAVNVPFCIELESLSILVCQISKRALSWFSQMQDKEIATFEVYFCLCRLVESVVPKETDLLLLKNVDTQLQHAILALSAIAFPQLIPPLNALSIPAPPSLSQVPSEAAARFRATGLQLLFSTLHLPVGRTHQWYTPVSKILFPTLRSADDTEMIIGFRGLSVFVSVIPVNEIEPFLLDCGTLIKLPSTLSAAAFTEIAQTISKLPCIIHQRRSQGDIIDKSNKCTVCAQSYSGELKSRAPPGMESIDLSFLVPFASFCEDHDNSAPAICKSVFARTLPIWLNHASSQEFILKENSLGQLLLQWTFNEAATVTEHASFVLRYFFHPPHHIGVSWEFIVQNQTAIVQLLQQHLDKATTRKKATLLSLLGELGRYAEDQALGEILLLLLKNINVENIFIDGLIFDQLRSFMRDRNQTPMELFGPYWKEIMRYVVDAYPSQPSILGQISRLLQISTKEFLKKTLPFTIPHLVVDENLAFLKMMSEIVGSEIPILCINSMSHIMALLLVQDQDVMAKGIRFVLQIALKEFQATDLETLLRSCTLSLVVALSEELGGGPAKREKSFQALCLVGRTLFKQPNVSKTNTSNHDIVRNLLKRYFLGILSHCNQVGTRSHRSVSLSNKRKSVKGLEEVLKIMSANVGFMTSQIIATLRLIFDENPRLRDETLSLWRTFVQTVDPTSLAPHLVHIVIILIRPFDEYNDAQIKILASIFEYFFQKETKNFQPYYAEAPLLPEIPHFAKFNQRLKEEKESLTLVQRIQILIKGISNDNELVAECSLNELLPVISDKRIYALIMTENVDENVQNVVKTLLLTLRKFNGQNLNIQRLCCRCLGVIGAIDPSRLDIAVKEDSVIVLDNFVDINESREFVCKLIEKQLVRAFRSSTNMTQQSFVAYALQQSLAFCGFTSDIVLHGVKPPSMTDSQYTEIRKQWNKFPKAVLDNITPFLESHYNLHMSQSEPVVYPIYPSTTTFRDWIKTWTIELIESVQGDNAIRIFAVCRNVVNGGDVNLALYILPHLVLNALISGSDSLRKDVLKELLSVLNNIGGNGNRNVEQSQLCTQTIFSLVDHLSTWLRRKRTLAKKAQQVSARRAGKAIPADSIIASDSGMKRVEKLLSEIPQELMAEASYRCNAYARALLHLEQHIRLERQRCSQTQLQPLYQFLQRIYSNIDETDGMEGISTMINTHDIDQQILEYESTGRWTAAQTCYELKLRNGEQSIRPHLGLSNCLKNLGHFETMMTHITGIMNAEPKWDSTLRSHAIEASWRLGRWEDVEKLSIQPYERRFESDIGKLLLASVNGPDVVFQMELQNIRSSLIGELAVSSMESYSRSYDHIVKLHMLREVEMIKPIISESAAQKLDELSLYMDYRLRITAPSYKAREPILNLRRILFDHKRSTIATRSPNNSLVNESTAHIWLQSAKIARKAGYYQTAQSAILHAEMMSTSYVHIERAKLLWCQGEERKAMSNLKTFLSGSISTMLNGKSYDSRVKAKTLLLLARWMESTSSSSSNEILSKYQLVLKEQPEWDKGYFFIGQYYNALLKAEQARNKDTLRNDARITKSLSLTLHVIINYAKALQYGARYVFQTLPRLLTLWLDAGNKHFLDAECRSDSDREFVKINNLIRKVIQRLPPYLFLTAFPQIVSRICHKNQNVFPVLETIMVTVLKNYPKQALWYLMSVSKSTIKSRYRRCHTIFAKVKSDPSGMSRNIELLISQANKFVDQLLALSNFAVPKSQSIISLSKEFRTLQRLVPVDLVIPLQEYLAVALPVSAENFKNHNPFASNLPTIAGFHDEVELMNSLVRPKKITIKGSDGKDYVFLCKPQDDLRKDNRLMEFNSVINKLLKKDPESRRRNLHIRTYAVIPLNETCGLIQWVPNTVAFRGILTRGYRARNIAISFSEVDAMLKSGSSPAKSFIDVVLPKFPSVFHEWFRETFPEPTSWFSSRLAYTRTAAVMSMVGFVLGLGDRHLENILFDETTGDTVHVDFNCLFEKGLTFAVPECVPFRLTHNMVDAMGITGYEGVFRKCCEISLNILRGNKELLLNILETFLYDPLCEWSKKKADLEKSGEIENEQAMKHITTIERKVLGSWKSGLPLSIEGQVHELITQATDPRNLAAMYIGWTPYM